MLFMSMVERMSLGFDGKYAREVREPLDLSDPSMRCKFVLSIINVYQLMVTMAKESQIGQCIGH